MDFKINNKHAFVSAASRGLGFAAALELAKEGAKVTICARNQETITESAQCIARQTGTDVYGVQSDVTQAEAISSAIETAEGKFGAIDILVTNAGGPPAGFLRIWMIQRG